MMPIYLPSREQNVVENLTIPAELAAAESGNETDKTGGVCPLLFICAP